MNASKTKEYFAKIGLVQPRVLWVTLGICWNSHELQRLVFQFPKVSIIMIIIQQLSNLPLKRMRLQYDLTPNHVIICQILWRDKFPFKRFFWHILNMFGVFCTLLYQMTTELVAFIFKKRFSRFLLIVKQSATTVGPLLTEVWQGGGGLLVFQRSLQTLYLEFLVWRTYSKVIKHLQRKTRSVWVHLSQFTSKQP